MQLTSAIIGKVSGEVLGSHPNSGNMAAFTAMEATEYNKIVHPTEKTASQTSKCKDFKCYMVQSAMREEELQRERDDISAGAYAGAAYSIYEIGKGLGYMVLYPVETADGIIYMIMNPKATGEMIKQDYKGRAITIAQGVNQQTPTGRMKAGFEVGRMEGDVGGVIGIVTTLPKIGSKTLGYANKIIASSKKSAITTLAETSPVVKPPTFSTSAQKVKNAPLLHSQLLAEEIAYGHAFNKHVVQLQEFKNLGIETRQEFITHLEKVIHTPSSIHYYKDGRVIYLHKNSGTVIIKNPHSGESTAFRPKDWNEYTSLLPKRNHPY